MSIAQYRGARVVYGSSNSIQVDTGKGAVVSVNVANLSSCSFDLFASPVSTNIAVNVSNVLYSGIITPIIYSYRVNAAATTNNGQYSPSVPTAYATGLFANVSGTVNWQVTYIPMGLPQG